MKNKHVMMTIKYYSILFLVHLISKQNFVMCQNWPGVQQLLFSAWQRRISRGGTAQLPGVSNSLVWSQCSVASACSRASISVLLGQLSSSSQTWKEKYSAIVVHFFMDQYRPLVCGKISSYHLLKAGERILA